MSKNTIIRIAAIAAFAFGAATLEAFKSSALQPLSSETVSDDDFSDGNTATATYPKVSGSTTNTFFKAKIEER